MAVSQISFQWLKSYFDNRQQRTVYNSISSDSAHVSVGVPQGSVLGPLMFFIYINDIQDCLQFTNATLYADDTALYCSSESANDLQDKLNHDLASVTNWMRSNKLTLNTSTSKFMLVGSRRRLGAIQSIEIQGTGEHLERVHSFKHLGIIINEQLDWSDHIDYIQKKVSSRLGFLRRIRHLPIKTRKLVYIYLRISSNFLFENLRIF